jgi:uncharacterized protein
MNLRHLLFAALLLATATAAAQQLEFPKAARADEAALEKSLPELARKALNAYPTDAADQPADTRLMLQLLAGDDAGALSTMRALRQARRATDPVFADVAFTQYEVYARARMLQSADKPFDAAYRTAFEAVFGKLEDKHALQAAIAFGASLPGLEADCRKALDGLGDRDALTLTEALGLLRRCGLASVYRRTLPLSDGLIAADDARRYAIEDDVLIKTHAGATLSAVVARKRGVDAKQPAALFFFIYADLVRTRDEAKQAAARGYVGVAVDTRGKRLSPDPITPYEHEVEDTHDVIDWIARQAWSDGRVAMYGGSYSGFAQWAATKKLHPALKTIVPYVAAIPGFGLPMENNVFLNANYAWPFYVGNNKYLDEKTYNDRARWNALSENWYASGRPYREIDAVDGTPNPMLQRWLKHPAFDAYWQAMIPWQKDYARINIPVLSVTGYYDDGQISALQYFKEHYKYNPQANHYLLIGPYDHRGAQGRPAAVLRGYTIDPVAHINVREITFQWLDHVLRGTERPTLIRDRVNYQVMGANTWRHAPSIKAMRSETLKLYLADAASHSGADKHRVLTKAKPGKPGFLVQTVDLANRKVSHNDYYPFPVLGKEPDLSNGFSFISEPFNEPVSVDGTLAGQLNVTLNKKDVDVGVVLYEVMPDGRLFHLTYFVGRASYARDMTQRRLLTPGRKESIPFERTRMFSRQLSKGSRLLVTLNVNVNEHAQINYGTGKDVSDESIADAKVPLRVRWHNDSYVEVPLRR